MIGQGAIHTSSSQGHPSSTHYPGGDANITALARTPFDSILSAPLPAASPNPAGDNRRPSAKAPHPSEVLKCPRCDSIDTKFCYYNNYSLTQPRYFCKNCKRYWTAGGALRNVPVGGGLRKNKRSKLKLAAAAADAEAAALAAQALAGSGGGQPQNLVEAAEAQATHIVDNRTASGPAPVAMPSHLVVGVPELGAYAHSGTMSSPKSHVGEDLTTSASHYNVKHMVDKNSMHSVAPTLSQQGGSFIGKDEANAGATFFCDPAHVPQFYSSYASSLPIQYGNAATPGGAVTGYAVNNYNFFTSDPNANARNEGCGSVSLGAAAAGGGLPSGHEVKPEKVAAEGSASSYDWQLIPGGLFTGAGAEPDSNFLYAPSSSWPDFSQFNDTGPG
ncbi:hypothetical protein L7F22_030759 [Adiantum nelumboides]|nr:hypothetical protein [Adiantum nelumboides]